MNLRFPTLMAAIAALLCAPSAFAQIEIKGDVRNVLDHRQAGAFATVSADGVVTGITVRGGGGGYTSAPVITIGPGSVATATATAVLSGGAVVSINVISGGAGYSVGAPPSVTIAPPAIPVGNAETTLQFAGLGATSATAGPINATSTASPVLDITKGRYPRARDRTIPGAPAVTVILARASFGGSFASGVPRYAFGDEIERPQMTWSGAIENDKNYWRAEPVKPGEVFEDAYVGNLNGELQPLVAKGDVSVTSCSTATNIVTVASVPAGLVSGATLLGQRVDIVNGLTLTLRGKPSETINSATARDFSAPLPYYYSSHAGKVFATQPGRVSLTWVSSHPDTSAPGERKATYKFKTEVFSVGSSPRVPHRTIFWTEKSFNGPLVNIPLGRIAAVNVVYNSFMPSHVANEYVPVGSSGPSLLNDVLKTVWFENDFGAAALHSYNLEGSVFVEYLGAENPSTGNRDFLGADIVSAKRSAEPVNIEVLLGHQLQPWQTTPAAGDLDLKPSITTSSAQVSGKALYGTSALANGQLVYHAERENDNPDKIQIYWLETKDAGIHPANALNLSIDWPKYFCKYTQAWSASLADYEPVTVTNLGNGLATGPQFDAAHMPQIIFQDDPAETETRIDVQTQRLLADFRISGDQTSRTLLKFFAGDEPWYVPLYIQAETKLGSPALADPDGAGPLNGAEAVSTINDTNADGVADLALTVNVGDRIEPPAGYSAAGYIAAGDNYYPAGYIDPFASGVVAAKEGAIIPVNTRPGHDKLTVWWFKEVAAPSAKFVPFHLPSKVGHYTVVYPSGKPQIVIASGIGTGDLGPSQQAGSIYVQNDATKLGFNPNEEHALLLGKSAYALRDDLNNNTTTSQPFVLLAYTNPADQRPSIDVYQVVRETFTYPLAYDAIAGTKAQPPGPLFALPLPLDEEGVVLNYEVPGALDLAAGSGAPASYASFTFQDRQGYDWTYRGAHEKTSASATASVSGGSVSEIILVEGARGSGYLSSPMVTVAPPASGATATATAIVSNGEVTGINLVSAGTGYTTAPEVKIAPPISFGMKFYYNSLPGFFEPSLTLANQRPVGTVMPFIQDTGAGVPVTLSYQPKWPDDPTIPVAMRKIVPVLSTAETLTLPKASAIGGQLPQIRGATSAEVIYQQSIANTGSAKNSVLLHDPTRVKTVLLSANGLNKLPPSILTSDYAGKKYFQKLSPSLQQRFYYDANAGTLGGLVLKGEFIDEIAGEDYLNLNALGAGDLAELLALCPSSDTAYKTKWDAAVAALNTRLETFSESLTVPGSYVVDRAKDRRLIDVSTLADIRDRDTAVDSYALSTTGKGTGYVTLVFENGEAFTDSGNIVSMQIIKVNSALYRGDLKVLQASNPLDEQVSLRHSGDYAGHPELYEFQWRYGFPTDGTNPTVNDSNISTAASTSTWLKPNGDLGGSILVGGSVTATISNPAVLMGDTYFTLNYRLKVAGQADDAGWSGWMQPKLVEGWIKRVLAKITPFNQRMSDLYNSEINTDVSMITQAGKRWEGDVALNLNNINDVGLIEIYETVLNRGKNFTVGSGIDFASANNGLILAAGYLNDLYTILGNEAYADAANPTISIDDQTTVTEVNTSRFSFEGQVSSSLDEELALLKGRDDTVNPGVGTAPTYNRLWWNYTRGINSGEVLYATNYNIKEKTGSSAANGVVDAADAQRMFPQGHGDAYGHYLTALKGYYKLLEHPYFTWQTSAEDVTVLGQSVQIDYKDERKFAAAAANLSSTARQVVALIHRKNHQDDPASGWSHFRDGKVNNRTGVASYQGLDEWVSRSTQASYANWVSANALLPEKDNNPNHSGVQVIDRTTVPELNQLASAASEFQGTIDSANSHLNPLGLSPGAIAFDISPSQMQAGRSHFEQIYDRALRATLNAKGAFNQAARMSRLLRNQENQISDSTTAYVDQEDAFVDRLIDLFGRPYSGDIGPGKTYVQDYDGPDLYNFYVVDRPSDLVNTAKAVTLNVYVPTGIAEFTGDSVKDMTKDDNTPTHSVLKTLTVKPNKNLLWASEWGGSKIGQRAQVGRIQQSLLESYQAQMGLLESNQKLKVLVTRFKRELELVEELEALHEDINDKRKDVKSLFGIMISTRSVLRTVEAYCDGQQELAKQTGEMLSEFFPRVLGLASDATSGARGTVKAGFLSVANLWLAASTAASSGANYADKEILLTQLDYREAIAAMGFKHEERQQIYEFEKLYREMLSAHFEVAQQATDYQRSNEALRNVLVEGQNVLADRETFRQRAAAGINGYRTKDLTFRTFRNEALEQYRTLFDLASRYTYLAAKSYDYETGLLGSTAGHKVIANIVASRALGDLSGDQPQSTVSTLGDAGLAGTLAQLNADFSVAEGRLGINNPDPYGTLFSLRGELYRIQDDPTKTSDDDAWKQTLQQNIVTDLMADPDVARYCNNLKKPDGSRVPGIVISFGSTIQHGKNFFGLPLAAGDHAYTPSSYATKIMSSGMVLKGYVGMDPYSFGASGAGGPATTAADALSSTPYVYLIPCGSDQMLAPPLGDTNTLRTWTVLDQALPLPYNLGASSFNTTNFFDANGTLSEQPWILRKHQAFRPVSDPAFFYSLIPSEFTNTRLVGRSVWNGKWKIVIPAHTLLNDEQDGLDRFVKTVSDIQLFLRTYSNSGN